MVGGEDHDRLVGESQRVELRQHAPELMVDLRLHAPRQGDGSREACSRDRVRHRHAALLDRRRLVVDPIGSQTRADIVRHPLELARHDAGRRHGGGVNEVGPRARRTERMVRVGRGDEEHERRRATLQKLHCPVRDPGVVVQRIGNARCPGFLQIRERSIERRLGPVLCGDLRMMRAKPLRIVAPLGREQRFADHEFDGVVSEIRPHPARPESRLPERHRLRQLERDVGHDRLQMQLAHRMGGVAGAGQQSGQGRDAPVHGASVGRHAVVTRIEPRDHRAPARRADLVRRQMVVEAHATSRDGVDDGRSGKRIAVAAEAVGPLLIGAEDHEIGTTIQGAIHSMVGRERGTGTCPERCGAAGRILDDRHAPDRGDVNRGDDDRATCVRNPRYARIDVVNRHVNRPRGRRAGASGGLPMMPATGRPPGLSTV